MTNAAAPKRSKVDRPECAREGCAERVKHKTSRYCSQECYRTDRAEQVADPSARWLTDDHRAYMRAYMADRYQKRWDAAVAQLGGRCVACGTTDQLEFDHIDPATKLFNIGRRIVGITEELLQAELAKCQLLCHDHHVEKSRAERDDARGKDRGPLPRSVAEMRAMAGEGEPPPAIEHPV